MFKVKSTYSIYLPHTPPGLIFLGILDISNKSYSISWEGVPLFCTVRHGVTVARICCEFFCGLFVRIRNFFFLFSLRGWWFFVLCINIIPNGSENFNTLLLSQILYKSFETFPEFSSPQFSQN